MKKGFIIIGLILLFTGSLFLQKQNTLHTVVPAAITPIPDMTNAKKSIESFTNGTAKDIRFNSEYNDPIWNGIVDVFKDSNGAEYRVDKVTNHVIFFLTEDGKGKIGSSTTIISPIQAEQIGIEFAKKNMIDFDNFTKNAQYSFNQDNAPKMDGRFQLTWIGMKPGTTKDTKYSYNGKLVTQPKFHSIIVLDKYGNIISFQNEYITEELGK